MANCIRCRKNLLFSASHTFPDKTKMCMFCYNKYLDAIKRQKDEDIFRHIAEVKQKRGAFLLLDAFIKKYSDEQYPEIEIEQLGHLLWEKYKINLEDVSIYDFLGLFKSEVKYLSDLGDFEKNLTGHNTVKPTVLSPKSTIQAKLLYYALKERGIECELEAFDGYKHVDLCIPEAKMYIEIDGEQHSTNPKQLSSDLKRDKYSHKDGFVTKRYTNRQINENLEEIADALTKVVKDMTE